MNHSDATASTSISPQDPITNHKVLEVHQARDYMEQMLPGEKRNRYAVMSANKDRLWLAFEKSQGSFHWLWRHFLGSKRPFKIRLIDDQQQLYLMIDRPWRWWFASIQVYDYHGYVGSVQRRLAWMQRRFTVYNHDDEPVCEIIGPWWRPWTFHIRQNGEIHGRIGKQWSGLGTEAITDADRFGIELPDAAGAASRKLLLAATFLIDFLFFEK